MKKKPEQKSIGPVRDEEFSPWNGITLNRCLAVAAIAALLSMGFQVLQDAVDDDLEDEAKAWTLPNQSDELSEPWFFEAWFGSSEPEMPVVEQSSSPDIEQSDRPMIEDVELPEDEEPELTSVEVDETIETEEDLVTKETPQYEKTETKTDSEKLTEQWGLKSKSKYMEAKAGKIRRATEDGSQSRDVFPFQKKTKDPIKSFADAKVKPYKEKSNQKKYENKYDHSKKQDYGKPYRKEKDEQNKYIKQNKGKKEEKESKGYKEYRQEKDHKKRHYN
ncbi:junctional sarcoplasmic reticulum protein 1 [Hyla sarda]|uniref:junctional sarcoplasmic reticulum protein 1 n=1 Tax=Hyla sarda TaxID=327740 RepID=UPI0024C37A65|nr:junctional sarcoplasmic reticulum protein 1 [Hyla sarda]XP_056430068.1 junctional sarcoplasmic reticulum protein 1 [Hyla sarda]XP_056430078.1 junctional sarcoplasmic reticulum protein 1 [Hyla sarda]XP_056430087.1 junctional sarcoplasmic reticulum protein 1 [Hyla sarda]XP_056430096.1 junctional sarcoplasmic reticulum protein 1 [Hyla sarda]XP_056430105.1 junctional sarcoplasmic reticulum protein 1 [Hyla sarda]XP_056430113.1 junctional sarcoplasmic reticulum protein 1 [Hyla sarda]XP_05643012